RLRDGLVIETAAADLALVGPPEVPIERHNGETRADHRIGVDAPRQADAGPEIVVVAVPEEALRMDPAAHAPAWWAGEDAGHGRAAVVVIRYVETSDTQ